MRISTLLFLAVFLFGLAPDAAAFVVVNPSPATEANNLEADPLAAATAYKESLKNMSAKERRQLKRDQRKQVKQALRDYQANAADVSENTLLLVIITILIPPLGVFLQQGEINTKFWISLVLTLLFYFPGLIYSLLVIFGNAKK